MFASQAFGQDTITTPVKSTGFTTQNWSKLGPGTEGPKGFTVQGRDIRVNSAGQFELWIKVLPSNTTAFAKRYDLPRNIAYVLQYATVDCEKRLLSFEKTGLYDSDNTVLTGRVDGLVPDSKKDSVKPGSIGESVYKYVCVDPATLPKSDQQ